MPTGGFPELEIQYCWRKYPDSQDIIDAVDIDEIFEGFVQGDK